MTTQQQLLEKAVALAQHAQSYMPQSSPSVVSIPTEDVLKLQQDCAEVWAKLEQVQADLVETRKVISAGSELESTLAIQKSKEKLLEGTVQAYRDSKPIILPQSSAIQQQLCLAALEKSVAELYSELVYIKTQRKETKEDIEKENLLLDQREQIHAALTTQLDKLESGDQHIEPNQSLVVAAEEKQETGDKYHRKLMKRLGRFIEQHFPRPTNDEVGQWARKRKVSSSKAAVLPLQAVIQELMNKCLDCDDPYVETDNRYWPPYMQLLVRCGVAQRDPANDSRFKMTPFYL